MLSSLPNPVLRPAWWQLYQWIANPLRFQDYCRQTYGDIFTVNLGILGNLVIVGNPTAVGQIFSQSAKFDSGRGNFLADVLVGANSIMLMDGDRHRRERKLLMPAFHGERLHTYAQQILEITHQVTAQWPEGKPFVARSEMQKISLEVVVQIVFGLSEGDRYQALKPLLTDWLNMVDSPLRSSILFFRALQKDWGEWSPWGQMQRRQQAVHALLQAEIDDRRSQNHQGNDVLSLMMAARDDQGQAMADEELRDELVSLLFAGHETTATTLSWAFYQLGQRPDVLDQLLSELDDLGDDASPMEVTQLPYLTAVCQEILRLYPVLPVIFPRIPTVPVEIGGYSLPPEITLMPSVYLVHYCKDIYPNPHHFDPERFLNRQYSPSEYLPFGGGNRRCLGYALALFEMKLVLATILSTHHLQLQNRKAVPLQRRGFTLSPKGGVKVVMMGKR